MVGYLISPRRGCIMRSAVRAYGVWLVPGKVMIFLFPMPSWPKESCTLELTRQRGSALIVFLHGVLDITPLRFVCRLVWRSLFRPYIGVWATPHISPGDYRLSVEPPIDGIRHILRLDWIPARSRMWWTPVTRWYELSFDSYRFCISAIWTVSLFWRTILGIHIREHVVGTVRADSIRHTCVCYRSVSSWIGRHWVDFSDPLSISSWRE